MPSLDESFKALREPTIMMVDDEPINNAIVQIYMAEEGYHKFVPVEDSTLAMSTLEETRPDLLLLDLMMPDVSGFDILVAVRSHPKYKHLPVIILTASADAKNKLKALDLGATDFLAKPLDKSELGLRVRNTLCVKAYQNQLEEQLHQSQKIESLGRLAVGVAHDYNNMLTVILGNVELGQMKVEPSSPVKVNLEQILEATNRSRDITRQLLAFARKQIINPKVIDLNASVENTLKMLRKLLGENIDLAWHPKEDLWSVKIDTSQLDQILANLCINASDAITDVGKMTIETDVVSFGEDDCKGHPGLIPGEYARLTVTDTGCGMDTDTLDKIFEPFFTTKQTGQGTGLGLATVYGIVKQNNGYINVFSEPDQGTTFKIYLPRCEEKCVVLKKVPLIEVQKGQGETILLVEDEVAIVKLVTAMLEDLGYRVLAANSPAEALTLAKGHQSDEMQLLLTDVVMPDMNGRDLAKQIQRMHPNIKTLYMSGYTTDVIAHHGVLDEGLNFIQKPFSLSDLSNRIRVVLDSKA